MQISTSNVLGLAYNFLSGIGQSLSGSSNSSSSSSSSPLQTLAQDLDGNTSNQGSLFKKMQRAVLGALQSAGSNLTPAQANKTVENAIAQVLSGNQTTSASSSGTSSSSQSDSSSITPQQFFQTLSQYGIDQNQFSQDYMAAVGDVGGSSLSSVSNVIQTLPKGLLVNALG